MKKTKLGQELIAGLSEAIAYLLSVTPSTIRAWEQGLKSPSGAASRLFELAEAAPEIFQRLIKSRKSIHDRK